MGAISLKTAKEHLNAWLNAEMAVTTGQSYTIGDRQLTRASLAEIRKSIEYWSAKVNVIERTEAGKPRNRMYRAVPRDI